MTLPPSWFLFKPRLFSDWLTLQGFTLTLKRSSAWLARLCTCCFLKCHRKCRLFSLQGLLCVCLLWSPACAVFRMCVCVHLVFRTTFISFCAWTTTVFHITIDHSLGQICFYATCGRWPSVRSMPPGLALLISLVVRGSAEQSHSTLDIYEWGWSSSCLLSQVFSLDMDRSFVVLKNLSVLRFYRAGGEVRVNCAPIFPVLYFSLSLPCSGYYPGYTCALSFAGGVCQVTF